MELLDQLRREGRQRTEGLNERELSYHDPCQIPRRGGAYEQPRNLLRMVAPGFEEMPDSGVMNWCCGGGGVSEETEDLWLQVFKRKKRQLDAVNVETLVTGCANCRIIIEAGLEHHDMDIPLEGLTELIAQYLPEEKPDGAKATRG